MRRSDSRAFFYIFITDPHPHLFLMRCDATVWSTVRMRWRKSRRAEPHPRVVFYVQWISLDEVTELLVMDAVIFYILVSFQLTWDIKMIRYLKKFLVVNTDNTNTSYFQNLLEVPIIQNTIQAIYRKQFLE